MKMTLYFVITVHERQAGGWPTKQQRKQQQSRATAAAVAVAAAAAEEPATPSRECGAALLFVPADL
jgi:hypothetical protein